MLIWKERNGNIYWYGGLAAGFYPALLQYGDYPIYGFFSWSPYQKSNLYLVDPLLGCLYSVVEPDTDTQCVADTVCGLGVTILIVVVSCRHIALGLPGLLMMGVKLASALSRLNSGLDCPGVNALLCKTRNKIQYNTIIN